MRTETLTDDPVLTVDARASRRLFGTGLVGLFLAIGWFVHTSPIENPLLTAMGVGIMILSALPALNWARQALAHFPVFEMFMLTSIPFYAVPLLSGHRETLTFSETATLEAAFAMLIFQAAALVTFFGIKGKPSRSPHLTVTLLPDAALRYAQTGMWLNTIFLYLDAFTQVIPVELYTIFRAAFFGIGTVSLFIEMRRWGAGQMLSVEKFAAVVNIFLQLAFLFRDLYLIKGMSILLLALLGYVSSSRRVPIVPMAIILPLIAVLHNGKPVMRAQYWATGTPLPGFAELPGFFSTWIENGLQPQNTEEETTRTAGLAGRLFERASLFQMLCLVTERTPEYNPFLDGESYVYLPAQIIPTILWPNKPSSMLSNIMLAVHYGLVPDEDPGNVSIAFGMVAEAYANFGLFGCGLLGLVLGFGYKRISVAAIGSPQFSALGLLTILLAAWSFQVEQIFATWVVSLFQAAIVVIGVPLVFRILFKQE